MIADVQAIMLQRRKAFARIVCYRWPKLLNSPGILRAPGHLGITPHIFGHLGTVPR